MREVDSVAASIQSVGEPYVNITFPLQGSRLPADHGYLLYSAIARRLPGLHHTEWQGIELISGLPSAQGLITLFERGAIVLRYDHGVYKVDLQPQRGEMSIARRGHETTGSSVGARCLLSPIEWAVR